MTTKQKQDISYDDVESLFEVEIGDGKRITAVLTRQTNNDTGVVSDYLNIREWYWSNRTQKWAAKRNGLYLPWSVEVLDAIIEIGLICQVKVSDAPGIIEAKGKSPKAVVTPKPEPKETRSAPVAAKRLGGKVQINLPNRSGR